MNAVSIAAVAFSTVAFIAVGFQLALAAGAPLGTYAMGGRFPGRFPLPMRVAALLQAVVLCVLAGIVLARAGLALEAWASSAAWSIWIVVGFSGLSLLMNSVSPSRGERLVWVPVAVVLLASSLIVALLG